MAPNGWELLLKAIDIRKIPTEVWLAFLLACGVVLFTPQPLASWMGAEELRSTHRVLFGLPFALAAAVLLAKLLTYLWRTVGHPCFLRWTIRRQLGYLAPDQKALMKRFLDENVGVLYCDFSDAVAESVARLGLIEQMTRFDMEQGFGFMIRPWLRRLLTEQPELLRGATPPTRQCTRERI